MLLFRNAEETRLKQRSCSQIKTAACAFVDQLPRNFAPLQFRQRTQIDDRQIEISRAAGDLNRSAVHGSKNCPQRLMAAYGFADALAERREVEPAGYA